MARSRVVKSVNCCGVSVVCRSSVMARATYSARDSPMITERVPEASSEAKESGMVNPSTAGSRTA
ncbi:hypothetical protein [Streptomyces hygroscopicus]|uniref:hypothetical protein n=1 Tax=Streptomyces hygroscopicus TaxID=1912 RepID=UPI00117C9B3C|nr:hypothetical protein [Streptomyces hygroscopicus]